MKIYDAAFMIYSQSGESFLFIRIFFEEASDYIIFWNSEYEFTTHCLGYNIDQTIPTNQNSQILVLLLFYTRIFLTIWYDFETDNYFFTIVSLIIAKHVVKYISS